VAEIASSSREQASGIEQVNKAITMMDDVTQQNAALVEQGRGGCAGHDRTGVEFDAAHRTLSSRGRRNGRPAPANLPAGNAGRCTVPRWSAALQIDP